ncbi:hypothetical protein AY601_5052 [Pedobacter cryoconitis]|uniref:Type VI secretion system needle protein Hcp n=1 Tax=Pedobacter cryoconitis TaxID=188932 RepID=A0A127VKM3_9SPHI|nr:type VI secretion system tube protein TssD [Pedobacter cryoconitis]AMQ01865.1 hypothetical protein AY601_5052 [Pedobacter cryoconitis]
MSSFKAVLKFADNPVKGYDILQCNYSFRQQTDDKGRPSSPALGGNVFIQITTPPDDFLLKWMVDSYKRRTGLVTFMKLDEESAFQRVAFEDAYCVEYHTNFNAVGSSSMVTSIVLSAKRLKVNGIDHNNDWPD